MYIAYIESGSDSHLINLDALTEDEAKRMAEIEATYIFGDGWKADWKRFQIKITVYKVEKEIEVFDRE